MPVLSSRAKRLLHSALGRRDMMQEVSDAIDASVEIGTSELADDAVTSAKLDQNLIQYADVEIAHAAILTLGASPVELVPAPGSGFAIEFISAYVYYDYDTAAYTLTTETIDIENGAGTTVLAAVLTNGEFIGTSDVRKNMARAVANQAPVDNSGLQLSTSGGTDPGGGDAAASMKVRVYYRVIPFSL